ncbi:phBC6A51 family helix-turn-helix protein [Mesobacillus foraminis]|uniref:phBC6A51 family helix-turn-helix protein n=1 Tax=Mesobacillus foraminis TaxID=279826 RepID=UPI0039A0E321
MKEIKAPASLNDEQIRLAKAFTAERHQTGISISDFCTKQGISTATWYKWKEDVIFSSYLTALGGTIISDDEREAYQIVKKKIMTEATKANAGVREIQLFLDNFSYIVEAEKQERMKELGIQPEYMKNEKQLSVEEKKASLLQRLKG